MKARPIVWALILIGAAVCRSDGAELELTSFDLERQKIAYQYAGLAMDQDSGDVSLADLATSADREPPKATPKSPMKAFLLSAAVPGLGQYYYGSRVKPFVFLGAEIAAWVLYIKWDGEGNDLTADYEAFNQAHWSRESYEQEYLLWSYGVTDDDSVANSPGITHHLPDTRTQQYYEMTGKYNQFAWGWDDASLDGRTLDSYSVGDPPPRILSEELTPFSARRLQYETMRDDANSKYDQANWMIIASVFNRLVSGVEAFLVTKSRNNKIARTGDDFARLNVRARVRSFHEKYDTPYVQFTFKF